MRTSNFSRNHPAAKERGWVSARRAAGALTSISDGVTEVDDVQELIVDGGQVTDLDDGIALLTIGGRAAGSNSGGVNSAAAPVRMFNNSGVGLIPGDVVIVDSAHDSAVTTTSTASNTAIVGVVQAPIAPIEYGPVLFNGFASVVNTTGTIARGNYALTSATAKAAGATTTRVAGSFGVYLTGTDFPDFVTASADTEHSATVHELDLEMPPDIPAGRVLFCALWLETSSSNPTITDWDRIGSESGFYYFSKVSEGDDTAEAAWTGDSVVVASVLLLNENVSLASPIASHDYDATTAAATVSGLSDAARYAIAGVQANVPSPGSGFIRLGGGTAASSSGGGLTIVQEAEGEKVGTSFASAVTVGNLLIAICTGRDGPTDGLYMSTDGATKDTSWTDIAVDKNTATGGSSDYISIQAKIATSGSAGPFKNTAVNDGNGSRIYLFEVSGVGVVGYEGLSTTGGTGNTLDHGTFASVGANDLVVMANIFKNTGGTTNDPSITATGYTEDDDSLHTYLGHPWTWVGHRSGSGGPVDAESTQTAGYNWAGVAAHFTSSSHTVAGTLAGKYIAHASSATSPFPTTPPELDAIFAVNLLIDAKASALLYGPDLGGGSGLAVGSNSTDVAGITAMGATGAYADAAHWHKGVNAVTSSSSNTLQRPIVNLRPGSGIAFGASDSDGSGEFDTLTISAMAAGGGGGGSFTVIRKSSTETVNGSDVLQNDDQLVFAIGASETWVVTYHLFAQAASNTPDIKMDVTGPVGATLMWGIHGTATGATTNESSFRQQSHTTAALASGVVQSATIDNYIIFSASILNSTNAGNVTLRWAQNTSNASNTSILAGSFLVAHKVS